MLSKDCDPEDLQTLTHLDIQKLKNLLTIDVRVPMSWKPELVTMLESGCKCEIEAVHKLRGLRRFCTMLLEAMARHSGL
jgi:DNA topoisomerase VI subunit A